MNDHIDGSLLVLIASWSQLNNKVYAQERISNLLKNTLDREKTETVAQVYSTIMIQRKLDTEIFSGTLLCRRSSSIATLLK